MKRVCLNMLVKNQKEAVMRCLSNAAPYITCWVIGDAGSTDGTQELVRSFFAARNIPGELHQVDCDNFSRARQEVFDRARASELQYDYVLLMEADTELGEQAPGPSDNLTTFAYKVVPRAGETYFNNRLLRRSAIDQWQQDIFVSLLNAAKLKEASYSKDDVLAAYTEAAEVCPTRAEALHGAARFCRINGIHQQGYEFAAMGLRITRPTDTPSSEAWIYDYGLLDELAVNAYWAGRYKECADACDRLLTEEKIPANQRDRISKNKAVAELKEQENRSAAYRDRSSPEQAGASTRATNHDEMYKRFLNDMDTSIVDQKLTMGFWQQTCEAIKKDAITGSRFDFLRWPSLTVFSVPESHIGPECYSELRASPEWESKWFNLTRDHMVGTPRNFSRDFGTSPILAQHAYHLYRYEVATGSSLIDCDVVFEVGGGYGSFCRLLRNSGFKGTHIIYDLPHVNSIQRLFLSMCGFQEVSTTDINSFNSKNGFCLVSDAHLDETLHLLKSTKPRVSFVATWSLSEMPISARERIFPRLHEICDRYLIAFQNEFINLSDTRYNIHNAEYFDALRSEKPDVKWHTQSINARNQYIFA
ncbi:MAG: hypothetical protein E5V49_14625 [Mesorhizobium sp.]|nr:hypothetical protein EN848_13390 [bacterium M00.F.Ca.ET.205.01.1.1]TGU53167.1 hypothetical protein EN795_16000 [bacterium M00.F.Ca.ET.152.01.1.1]TGV36131.1 hypothetical protein EN829_016045 [Mesorhizobium sp. M00.F.Ca.ET.186.01.1.1]TGZ43720.1 hypothetical protein EN805_11615 [bacterium M00.F.Ca.ET.162.01.1.1]TJW31849.1 MAG: hypothetical protein E5V49_14625 [Mesorhizobium sp.]